MLCTAVLYILLAIALLALGPPGLHLMPQACWIGIHMASIRFHCHNNNTNYEYFNRMIHQCIKHSYQRGPVKETIGYSNWLVPIT